MTPNTIIRPPASNTPPSFRPERLHLLGTIAPPTPAECDSLHAYLVGETPASAAEILRWCIPHGLHDVLVAVQRDHPNLLLEISPGAIIGSTAALEYLEAHPAIRCRLIAFLFDDDRCGQAIAIIQRTHVEHLELHCVRTPCLAQVAAALAHPRFPLKRLEIRLDRWVLPDIPLVLATCGPELIALRLDDVRENCLHELQRIVGLGTLKVLDLASDWALLPGVIGCVNAGLLARPGIALDISLGASQGMLVHDPVVDALCQLVQNTTGVIQIPGVVFDFDAMTRILPTVRRSGRARRMQALRQPRPYGLDLLRQINEVLASRFNASQEAVAGAIARELLGAVFHIRLPTPKDGGSFEVVAANVAGNLGPRLAPADVARLQQVSKQIGEGPAKPPAGTPPPPPPPHT